MDKSTNLYVGYAKLPTGMAAETIYKFFGVGLLIEPSTGQIVDAETTAATNIGNKFLVSIMIGRNISEILDIAREIEDRYFGVGIKAIIAALMNSYEEYVKNTGTLPSYKK